MRIFLMFVFFVSVLGAQEVKLVEEKELIVDRFIGYDTYNHLYYIKDGVLHKTGDLGDLVFQDFQLGPITSVDFINPLNVVVFYAEVNTVVFLDNRLNEKERINFNDLPSFINVSSATNAGNNRLWIFNMDTQQLQLYDYRVNRETVFSNPYEGKILAQISNFNDCFILTSDHLWRINIYGSLLSEKSLANFETIVGSGKSLIALKQNKLYHILESTLNNTSSKDQIALNPLELNLGENNIKDLQLTQDFLYIYHGIKLSKYTLTQPK